MMKQIGILAAVGILSGCAMTENITVTNHTYTPFFYNYVEYEHPVDAVYLGGRHYPAYQNHRAYTYMSNIERLAVDHYLRSLNHCYSGNWFISVVTRQGATLIEGNNGRRCDNVMQVYRNLYTWGYSWQSLADVVARGPFSKLLKTEDQCKVTGAFLEARLDENGKAHFYCGEDIK